MNDREKLEKKVHDAPHMSKPDEADLVFYDGEGRHIFEVYAKLGEVTRRDTSARYLPKNSPRRRQMSEYTVVAVSYTHLTLPTTPYV